LRIDENGRLGWGATKLKISVPLSGLFPTSFDIPSSLSDDSVWEVYLYPNAEDPSPYAALAQTPSFLYEDARKYAGIQNMFEKKEVLLGNKDGKLIGGSTMLVLCEREGRWLTPRLEDGAEDTAVRRWLLEKGLGEDTSIEIKSLKDGELVWLGNGIYGFQVGRLRL
jgi:4-amino-4-deoxychorismate lyase